MDEKILEVSEIPRGRCPFWGGRVDWERAGRRITAYHVDTIPANHVTFFEDHDRKLLARFFWRFVPSGEGVFATFSSFRYDNEVRTVAKRLAKSGTLHSEKPAHHIKAFATSMEELSNILFIAWCLDFEVGEAHFAPMSRTTAVSMLQEAGSISLGRLIEAVPLVFNRGRECLYLEVIGEGIDRERVMRPLQDVTLGAGFTLQYTEDYDQTEWIKRYDETQRTGASLPGGDPWLLGESKR